MDVIKKQIIKKLIEVLFSFTISVLLDKIIFLPDLTKSRGRIQCLGSNLVVTSLERVYIMAVLET